MFILFNSERESTISMVEITSFWLIRYSNEHLEECVALLFTVGIWEDAVRPQVCSRQSPGGNWGQCNKKNFSGYAYKIDGNERIERMKF